MYRAIPGYSPYEITVEGDMRNSETGKTVAATSANAKIVGEDGLPVSVLKTKLVHLAYPHTIPGTRIPTIADYTVDTEGKVYSLLTASYLTPAVSAKGYNNVSLKTADGSYHTMQVHRLVAMTYLPAVEGKDQVNHKNGDKLDNRVENLEWCTPRENLVHAYTTGLNDTKLRRCKVSADNGETWTEYNSLTHAAEELGISSFEITTTARKNNVCGRRNAGVDITYNPFTCHGLIVMYSDSKVTLCSDKETIASEKRKLIVNNSVAVEISLDGVNWLPFYSTVQAAIYASGGTTKYGKYIAERADYNQGLIDSGETNLLKYKKYKEYIVRYLKQD